MTDPRISFAYHVAAWLPYLRAREPGPHLADWFERLRDAPREFNVSAARNALERLSRDAGRDGDWVKLVVWAEGVVARYPDDTAKHAAPSRLHWERCRILVIDDDAVFADLLISQMRKALALDAPPPEVFVRAASVDRTSFADPNLRLVLYRFHLRDVVQPLLTAANRADLRVLAVTAASSGTDRGVSVSAGAFPLILESFARQAAVAARDGVGSHTLAGASPAILALRERLEAARPHATLPVLFLGPTGAGKGHFAEALAGGGTRLAVENAAALTPELFQAELFGHTKGAFTGAATARQGAIRSAGGGCLLLDEVDALGLQEQAALLRVIQEQKVRPVGAEFEEEVKVRFLFATNKDLPALVAEGRFREDLFYRISMFPVHVPPLNERKEDIPVLVHDLLKRIGGGVIRAWPSTDGWKWLLGQPWTGNVRELASTLWRGSVLAGMASPEAEHENPACVIIERRHLEDGSLSRPSGVTEVRHPAGGPSVRTNGTAWSNAASFLREERAALGDVVSNRGPLAQAWVQQEIATMPPGWRIGDLWRRLGKWPRDQGGKRPRTGADVLGTYLEEWGLAPERKGDDGRDGGSS